MIVSVIFIFISFFFFNEAPYIPDDMLVTFHPVFYSGTHHQLLFLAESVGSDSPTHLAESLQRPRAEMCAEFLPGAIDPFQI